MKSSRLVIFSAFAFVFFTLAAVLNLNTSKQTIKIDKQSSALNFSTDLIRFSLAGYKRLSADILWITTLLESDTGQYKNKDLNNWMYMRFNSILELDPKFLIGYQFGAQYLSIIKDDLLGAEKIFEKGLSIYPDNYFLNYNAGFLYAFELNKPAKAIRAYERILAFPQAPAFLPSLISKLRFKEHKDLHLVFELVQENLRNTKDELMKLRLLTDLYAIKAEIDLKCLNNGETNCSHNDYNGAPYLYRDGRYHAQKAFKPYRLNDSQ